MTVLLDLNNYVTKIIHSFEQYMDCKGIWINCDLKYSSAEYIVERLNYRSADYDYIIIQKKRDGGQTLVRNSI